MLLLAYLMTRSKSWRGAKIRVFSAGEEGKEEDRRAEMANILENARIQAESEIVSGATAKDIARLSDPSAFLFLPFRFRGNQVLDQFGDRLGETLSRLPVAAAVLAAEDIDLDAEPEEGRAGEVAAALDALSDAEKKAKDAEEDAAAASEKADQQLREMRDAALSGIDREALMKMAAATREAREQATKSARRAAKAWVKAENAARAAEALGAKPAEPEEEREAASD
jgi:hypothetical protein